MRFAYIILAIAIGLMLSGCPMVDLKELNFTRTKPDLKNLVGTWTATKETFAKIHGRGRYPEADHKIVLRPDGTFSIVNMPDWRNNGIGESHGKFESTNGQWILETDSKPGFFSTWRIALNYPNMRDSGFDVYYQSPPYLIFVRVGDPNSGEGMFFERLGTP